MTTRVLVQATRTGLSLPELGRLEEEILCARGECVKAVNEHEHGDTDGWMYKSSVWVRGSRWEYTFGMMLKALGCEETTREGCG